MTVYLEEESSDAASFDFDYDRTLKDVILTVLEEEDLHDAVQVSVTFTDEEHIKDLNHRFRNIDLSTDVLSFPMLSFSAPGTDHILPESMDRDPQTDELLLGDIVLCIPAVFDQAERYGHSVKREYVFLLVHSMLHLLGYDHIEDEDRQLMEEKQRIVLEKLSVYR